MNFFTRIVSISTCTCTCLIIFTFAEPNLLQNTFSQVPNMNNIIPDTDPLFKEKVSLLQCMSLCVTLLPCLSVFFAKRGSCRGYQLSHRHLNGVGFLRAEGETYYYKEHNCLTTGYTWNSTHEYCYKYHTKWRIPSGAINRCYMEDPRSHLFLVDSENALEFLQYIIDLYETIMYLQGKRKDGSSPFLDDFGRNITFLIGKKMSLQHVTEMFTYAQLLKILHLWKYQLAQLINISFV